MWRGLTTANRSIQLLFILVYTTVLFHQVLFHVLSVNMFSFALFLHPMLRAFTCTVRLNWKLSQYFASINKSKHYTFFNSLQLR